MTFTETPLAGAFLIELNAIADNRGYFARTFCEQTFAEHGLNTHWPQHNVSFNKNTSTLRGLHYQQAPHQEIKLIQCVKGALVDVIVDLREDSETFLQCFMTKLSEATMTMFYIPKGFAHGFQTTQPDTTVSYLMSHNFYPESARTINPFDPQLNIAWPEPNTSFISEKDKEAPCW